MSISVLVLTLDEERNLGRCLEALRWCDDVVVLDSFSADATEAIAKGYGVRFEQRRFDHYAGQRNFGLNGIPYRNPWVLMVDADEVVTPPLVAEMRTAVAAAASDTVLYRLRRKDFFLGRWIKRSSGYPTWFGRLARVGRVRVEREVNEEYIADGQVGLLQEHLQHYPFNKGFAAWIDKHNRYSTMEAQALLGQAPLARFRWRDLFSRDPAERRASLKALLYALPGRPLLVFAYLYLVRGGFLDGRAGLVFSLLRSGYEFLIDCKVLEGRLKARSLPL